MCGPNKDCGCNAEQKAAHEAEALTASVLTPLVDAQGQVADLPQGDISAPPDVVVAAGEPDLTTGLPSQWHAVLTVEGLRTSDHRLIRREALTWRQLPIAIFAQFKNAGHADAEIVGSVTSITREETSFGTLLMGEGTFSLDTEAGRQAAQMCADQTLRWGSVDLDAVESQYVEVSTGGGDLIDLLLGDEMDSGNDDWYEEIVTGRIAGYTMVPIPAFPQAVVAPIDVDLDIPDPMGSAPQIAQGLMASGVQVPAQPPASWFRNPELQEATSLSITEDGRIFGHLALWNTCHTGFQDVCIVPPHSEREYAYFCTGSVLCEGGDQVRVGQITFDTGHAGSTLGWQDTTAHYDNTGTVAADVAVGEDEHGIWFAGALRNNLDDDKIRAIRAAALSGDWRKIGGGLELVAALAVNSPGFPIVASLAPSLVAAGVKEHEQISLITAGLRPQSPIIEMARQIAEIKKMIKPLLGLSIEQLNQRVNPVEIVQAPVVSIDELRARINTDLLTAIQ